MSNCSHHGCNCLSVPYYEFNHVCKRHPWWLHLFSDTCLSNSFISNWTDCWMRLGSIWKQVIGMFYFVYYLLFWSLIWRLDYLENFFMCKRLAYGRVLKPLSCWISFTKHKIFFAFCIISQHWDGASSWNPSLWMTRTHPSCVVNTIAADGIATQGSRASAANVLICSPKICQLQHQGLTPKWEYVFFFSYIYLNNTIAVDLFTRLSYSYIFQSA